MSTPRQAVFLSYASQDAEPVRRIAEALRAAEIEVWFDQNELVGGDAWDHKIRDQISACSLFVPVISANSQARREGYFRLEWKLADERTHLMADGTPFLFPVVLDDTRDRDALVPKSFLSVQWTRLPNGEASAAFVKRVSTVLQNPLSLSPSSPIVSASPVPGKIESAPPAPRRARPTFAILVTAAALIAAATTFLVLRRPSPAVPSLPTTPALVARPTPASPLGGSSTLMHPDLLRAMQLVNSTEAVRSDVTVAEDLAAGVLKANPTDIDATLVMGRIQVYYLIRGFDRTEERFVKAKQYADRGLALAPNHPEALAVMGAYLYRRDVDVPRATKLLREAIALRPDEPFYYRMLDNVLSLTPGITDREIIESALITAKRFPQDALVQYEVARHYRDASMFEETVKYLDRAIELGPVANALVTRAGIKAFVEGDPPGMKALLDQLPDRYHGTARSTMGYFVYASITGQTEVGHEAVRSFADPWMFDFDYTGPTALLAGELYLQENRPDLARVRFTEALAELGRHPPDLNRFFSTQWLEPWILMRLGRLDEARARNALYFTYLHRPFRLNMGTNWWFNPIPACLLYGERDKALELLREGAKFPHGVTILRNAMRYDWRMAPFGNDPGILAILNGPAGEK